MTCDVCVLYLSHHWTMANYSCPSATNRIWNALPSEFSSARTWTSWMYTRHPVSSLRTGWIKKWHPLVF